jgi:hypothetical protein
MDNYCAFCDANKILYQGNDSDKRKAKEYKRQARNVSNVVVVEDPRDANAKDDKFKVNGTMTLYEFPATIESKVRNEITDKKEGLGMQIFDPANGFDMILKVKAKPKDEHGKEWPDYADTVFSRRPSAVAETEEEIEKLMSQRVDLAKYLKSMEMSVEETEALLKAEMLWDDVARSFEKAYKSGPKPETRETLLTAQPPEAPVTQPKPVEVVAAPEAPVTQPVAEEKKVTPKKETAENDTDALLLELAAM